MVQVALKPSEISAELMKQIESFQIVAATRDEGQISSVKDATVRSFGFNDGLQGELVEFDGGVSGLALNLERDSVAVVILGDASTLCEGMIGRCTGRILEVPVGPALLGRVVDPLGNPIDGKGPIKTDCFLPIERIAPGVIERKSVDESVQTGLKAIDAMLPIGRGQRALIIGD